MALQNTSWALYALFAAVALYLDGHPDLFVFSGLVGVLKAGLWVVLLGFLGYSVYCTSTEGFVGSLRTILRLKWGRQVGMDLYLGLGATLLLIGLYEGALAAALWLVPLLLFANLTTLLYLVIHLDGIAERLMG